MTVRLRVPPGFPAYAFFPEWMIVIYWTLLVIGWTTFHTLWSVGVLKLEYKQ